MARDQRELGLPGARPGAETTTIDGVLERVVFSNEETSWSVVRITVPGEREPITAVGNLLGVQVGENLRLTGKWVRDPRHGEQLKVESYLAVKPSTLAGIERYLASGLVPGIGPTMAKRLVEKFGIETLDVVDHDAARLTEVEGIGPVRAKRIVEAWAEQRDVKDVMVFLQSHGVSTAFAIRIYKRYGKGAINVVRANPYQLAEDVFGIGFKTADQIAEHLGIAKTSPHRLEAGVLHALSELAEQGHVFAPRDVLVERARALLDVDVPSIEAAIGQLEERDLVRLERVDTDAGTFDAVYGRALHEAEVRAAKSLARIVTTPMRPIRLDVERAVEWYEAQAGFTLAEQQRSALARSISAEVSVITGGPGTGKTTIVRGLLEILEKKGRRMLLGAPTGRAAKRLAETTGREAKTIHRLLELDPKDGGFTRDEDNPLEADVVIIDEVSMVDVLLFDHLLRAVPPEAQLVLVGDIDQLPSVGPGSVLKDVIASKAVEVTRLTQIFRQAEESLIVVNAHRINQGELPLTERAPRTAGGEAPLLDFYVVEKNEPEDVLAAIKELVERRIPARFGLDPVDDVQVLTPMHKGSLGAQALNAELQALLNPRGDALVRGNKTLRTGDKVMQVRNNYDLGVFNGDIGRIKSVDLEASSIVVTFDDKDVRYETSDLDELVLAYACSIHKSQGSEYPAVVLPLATQHWVMLERNLVYTAVTRGKRLVVIVGSKRALKTAIDRQDQTKRFTALAARIQHAVSMI
ncbi:ATP-dependent RecD-like DNA helicase [Myxococcota bacterium]|nr:ATP-dependent RecD-like DNA helicase [Myxococcota bacterium]